MEKCIITACSNRFFPSVLNLIGSIKANYPNHPKIYVYSLGLLPILKNELKTIENIELIEMPHFCKFWESCYTWKTYIFNSPLAYLNLYLDAGNQVLKPLDEIFQQIKKNEYFAVGQGGILKKITPVEYKQILGLNNDYDNDEYITAGVFGFKNSPNIGISLNLSYQTARAGLCLGFSESEFKKRNKGKDKSIFIRNCELFRHDQTLLNLYLRKYFGKIFINNINKYAGWQSPNEHPEQLIWNLRRNYKKLEYADKNFKKNIVLKKILLKSFFMILNIKRKIKDFIQKNA